MTASRKCIVTAVALAVVIFAALSVSQAAVWISGSAPDWNQPYDYGPPLTTGPGGWPVPPAPAPWSAWCAPTSASNLVGYWEDGRGRAIADGLVFGNTANYGLGASWHDYNLDGSANRLARAAALPVAPGPPADLGWYMDTNNIGTLARGNGVDGHAGTYIKDMHAALGDYLSVWGTGWMAKTEGQAGPIPAVAYTTDPVNYTAAPHPNPASAFAQIQQEINADRTLIISFNHWDLTNTQIPLAAGGAGESTNGGTYYTWKPYTGFGTPDPGGHGEIWNGDITGEGLGHAVTAVGYILAGSLDDLGVQFGLGPTDWVIVHDNWSSTARNVIVPFDQGVFSHWVANTTVIPEPSTIVLLIAGAIGWWLLQRKR